MHHQPNWNKHVTHGRAKEIDAIKTILKDIEEGAPSRIVAVTGPSGVGKSVLVTEGIYPAIRGYIAAGKFDQFLPQTPYAAVLRCLRSLFQAFFFNPKTTPQVRAEHAQELIDIVGPNREVICGAIPEIGSLFPHPDSPSFGRSASGNSIHTVSLSESRNRFHAIFLGIIAMVTRENMVTLFIDDVQWADTASLDLIASLVEGQRRKLLVIVSSREPSLPLTFAPLSYTTVFPLSPFTVEDVKDFICKVLQIANGGTLILAEALHQRTAGNPFFVSQLLRQAVTQHIVAYDSRTSEWSVDVVHIPFLTIASDIVEFLLDNFKRLPPAVCEVLRVASCLGSAFTEDELEKVLEKLELDTHGLYLAEREGLVVREPPASGGGAAFRFSHDRVMQAAHSKNTEEQIQKIHLVAGEVLSSQGKDLYEVADHFAKALPLVQPSKYVCLCELYLKVAKNAKLAAAFDSASRYAQVGLKILEKLHEDWPTAWKQNYLLTYPLSVIVMECSFNNGELELSESCYRDIQQHATQEGATLAASARVILLVNVSQFSDAIDVGCAAMSKLVVPGASLPRHPTPEELGTVFFEIDRLLCGTPAATLESLPPLTDPLVSIAISLLVSISTASYFFDNTLFAYSSSLIVQLTLQHGITPQATPGLGIYALLCSSLMNNCKRAFEVGESALRLSNKYGILTYQCQVHFLFSCLLSFYQNHIRENLPLQRRALTLCKQVGNTLFAAFCTMHIPMTRLWSGDSLEGVSAEAQHTMDSLGEQCRFADGYPMASSALYCCKMLLGVPCDTDLENSRIHVSPFGTAWAATLRIKAHTLLHKFDDVLKDSDDHLQKVFDDLKGQMHICMYFFYYSLALISLYHKANPTSSTNHCSHYVDKVNENMVTLRKWAANSKKNCEHQCMLVDAELAHISHRDSEALQLFKSASLIATEREFHHHKAVILERMAEFYMRTGNRTLARETLMRSIDAYTQWGASAVVAMLVDEHHELLVMLTLVPLDPIPHNTPLTASGTNIDVTAVLECSSVVTESSNLGKLLINFLSRIVSYFKAAYGCVFLQSDQSYFAHSVWNREQTEIPQASLLCPPVSVPLDQPSVLCSIRALRSAVVLRRTVVVNDVPASGIHADVYFKSPLPSNTKSLVCTPLLLHGNVLGAVYLESDSTHTFALGNLQTLQLMSAQASIAIENSRLVETSLAAKAEAEVAIAEKDYMLQEIQASKQRYRMLAQGIPQLVWSARVDGSVEWANEQFLSYIGSSALGDVWSAYVHEEDIVRVRAAWHNARTVPGESFSEEIRLRDANGNYQWFLTRGLPAHDSRGNVVRWFGTCTNVDVQKRSLEERARLAQIETSERHYRTLAEALPQLVWTSLPDGRVNYYNGKWKEFSGVSLTEGEVMGWLPLVHPADVETCKKKFIRAMNKCKGFEVECRLRRYDGQYRWHLVRAVSLKDTIDNLQIHIPSPSPSHQDSPVPMEEDDEHTTTEEEGYYYFGTGTDIDDQKKAEVSLIDARKAAERMAEMKSQWVANMSHELRTPSNGILGMLDLLMDTPLTPEQKDYVATMRRSTNVLLTVISDILDFRRNETKQMKLQTEPFSVQSVMEDVCEILFPLASAKNVELVHVVSPDVPRVVIGDAARLRQVLVNLISNSIKFSKDVGGHVEVTCTLTATETSDTLLTPTNPFSSVHPPRTPSPTLSASPTSSMSPISSAESTPNSSPCVTPRFATMHLKDSDDSFATPSPVFTTAVLTKSPQNHSPLSLNLPSTPRLCSANSSSSAFSHESVWLKFQVMDLGVGIPKEQQAMLFEPFFQVDSSATRKHGGTGLGLAISRQIVAALNGRIWVESEEDNGSIFSFTAQFALPTPPPSTTPSTPSSTPSNSNSTPSNSTSISSPISRLPLDLHRLNSNSPTRFYSSTAVPTTVDNTPSTALPQQVIIYSESKSVNMRITETYLSHIIPSHTPSRSVLVAASVEELTILLSATLSHPLSSSIPFPYVACVVELYSVASINSLMASLTQYTSRRDRLCRIVMITTPHMRAQITLPYTPSSSIPPIVFLMKPLSESKLRTALSIAPVMPSPPIKLSPRMTPNSIPHAHSPHSPSPQLASLSHSSSPLIPSSPLFPPSSLTTSSSLIPSPSSPTSITSSSSSLIPSPLTPPPLCLSEEPVERAPCPLRRALCVEDNAVNQKVIIHHLGKLGFLTDLAQDGKEAVDMVTEHPPGYYDFVLMDLQMPVMDGFVATKHIREREVQVSLNTSGLGRGDNTRIPIIALTANVMAGVQRRCSDAGMDGYVSKPVQAQQLLQVLRDLSIIL